MKCSHQIFSRSDAILPISIEDEQKQSAQKRFSDALQIEMSSMYLSWEERNIFRQNSKWWLSFRWSLLLFELLFLWIVESSHVEYLGWPSCLGSIGMKDVGFLGAMLRQNLLTNIYTYWRNSLPSMKLYANTVQKCIYVIQLGNWRRQYWCISANEISSK